MNDVTQILSQIEHGDAAAAERLLPLVYDELRRLAAARMAHEKPGQTLQATALVHEAYVRLVDAPQAQQWDSRGHFFAAAAEAMRRILVENARRKARLRHGGNRQRVDVDGLALAVEAPDDDVLAVHEALEALEQTDPDAAKVVKLHYFLGQSFEETGRAAAAQPAGEHAQGRLADDSRGPTEDRSAQNEPIAPRRHRLDRDEGAGEGSQSSLRFAQQPGSGYRAVSEQ